MYPTKSTYEYMSEINRLFPKNTENDYYQTPNTSNNAMQSPFQQSTSFNRSSSSADSASSGSFPDMYHRDRLNPINRSFDTPFGNGRQRPIIGRKIFDKQITPTLEPIPKPFEDELLHSIWNSEDQSLFQSTPPKTEQKKYNQNNQNLFYELFPTEQKDFDFKTPVSPRSPVSSYHSYRTSSIDSPIYSPKTSNVSPNSSRMILPQMPTSPIRAFQNQLNFASTSSYDIRPAKMCTFCRKNGETPLVYMTHTVKEKMGCQHIVTCPILRSHVCSECGASGDNAHTITYCPVLRNNNNGVPLQSTTITLKNTRIKSNGRRRY